MAKKAPFFSHDMNARHDPKISAMRGVYGAEGYGWFWMLNELMAESDGYQLDCKSKYAFNAYAMQLQCKSDALQKFVSDCIEEFELYATDGITFWSNSLRKRMQYRDAVSEKRAEAANKRWEKKHSDANALNIDANAMQKNANKTKQNETKQNETEEHTRTSDSQKIIELINRYNIECKGIYQLEQITAYSGLFDIEVIESAIKQSEGKGVKYAMTILDRLGNEGKTSKETLGNVKKFPETPGRLDFVDNL